VATPSPEYWADRVEARLADAGLELNPAAIDVLRRTVHSGATLGRKVEPQELERSLDIVTDRFIVEIRNAGVSVVDAKLFNRIWGRVCIYPWCRKKV
jgi:hypothetical protein